MKFFTANCLSLMLLACALTGSIEASRCADNSCASEDRGCCFSSCYECGCNPLYCGAWDLQVQAGVAPILWRNRGDILGVSCATSTTSPLLALFQTPKFNKLHKTPWIVGGQIGYHWSDNARMYVEFNYSQANRKSDVQFATSVTGLNAFLTLDKYKVFDAYVGARYYWDRWCDRVAFFLGGKVGITHHKSQDVSLRAVLGQVTSTLNFRAFDSNTVVSGGADFGLDFCFCGNWSFVITGSVLASCGPRAARFRVVNPQLGITDIIVGGIGSELRFPVTAGVRYSF